MPKKLAQKPKIVAKGSKKPVAVLEGVKATEVPPSPVEASSVSPTLPSGVSSPSLSARLRPSPVSKDKPTAEQQKILDAAVKAPPVLVIEAGAGTGKTSSLRMLADVLKGNGQYTAFNSALVGESKEKFQGTRVSANTTHSLAFRSEGKRFSKRLNGGRVRSDQVAVMLGLKSFKVSMGGEGNDAKEKTLSASYLAGQVLGAIKRYCQSAEQEVELNHFRYIDGIDAPDSDGGRVYDNNKLVREYLLPYAHKAWKDLSNPEGQLPFAHDHYVKVWQLSKPVIAGNFILLDEAQDTAPVMLDVLKQQTVPIILVGDSAQQIYEWRGAINALASFGNAPRLYLTQSFRFGQAIANVANAVLETLDEKTELRLIGLPSIDSVVAGVEAPDCILTRTNALAVTSLLEALAAGRKPFLVGGGGEVVSFVEAAVQLQNLQPTSHPDLACFSSWTEVQEYSKLDEGEDLRLMVKLIDGFTSQVILDALKKMSSEKEADITICTAHKSKGRAWGKVQLAPDFPTKSKCGDSDKRLLYVAVTRARFELDITRCPFFTGQDSLDLTDVIKNVPKPVVEGILPAVPSEPPAPTQFTWSKRNDKWVVRGPKNNSGNLVEVYRKDGSCQKKKLGKLIEEFGVVALYEV